MLLHGILGWSIILCADWFIWKFLQVECVWEFLMINVFMNKLTPPIMLVRVKNSVLECLTFSCQPCSWLLFSPWSYSAEFLCLLVCMRIGDGERRGDHAFFSRRGGASIEVDKWMMVVPKTVQASKNLIIASLGNNENAYNNIYFNDNTNITHSTFTIQWMLDFLKYDAVSGESLACFVDNIWSSTEDPFCQCQCCWFMQYLLWRIPNIRILCWVYLPPL